MFDKRYPFPNLMLFMRHSRSGLLLSIIEVYHLLSNHYQTVRNWFKRWTAEGIEGLKDRPMPERPAKVTKVYKEQVLMAVRRRPRALGQPYSLWTYQRLADYMAEQTGLRVSYETVRRVLAAQGIVLSRPQHKVSSPDPEYLVKKRRLKKRETP
jgi:transposase